MNRSTVFLAGFAVCCALAGVVVGAGVTVNCPFKECKFRKSSVPAHKMAAKKFQGNTGIPQSAWQC